MKFNFNILLRVGASLVLAGAALGLFLMQKPKSIIQPPPTTIEHNDWRTSLPKIDQEIDTILAHAGIDKSFYQKKQFPITEAQILRIERRIEIPIDIIPVELNQMLNAMVQKFNGRAIASENSKEHLVTIHVELNGYIIQTLILHPNASLKRKEQNKFLQSKI